MSLSSSSSRYPERIMRRLSSASLALIASLAVTIGCGSGGTTTPTTGSITLALSPANASIQQGGTANVSGTIARTNFTGDVTITTSGAPTGVTGVVTLSPVNGGNSAQVTITAASTTPTGTYPITVTASGSGISSVSATYTLTITPLPSSFSFTVAPTGLTIAQGNSSPLTGTVVRSNFPGDIAISVTGAPTGVTTTVTQSPVNGGNTATVNVAVAGNALPGQSTLTVTANGGAQQTIAATAQLIISVTGSFTIAAGNTALSVVQGQNSTTSINATRTGGFGGTPVYTVTGPGGAALPTGLTAAVTPTGTADQNALTVTTATGLATGTYPVVVNATAFGVASTATVNVTVTPIGSGVHLDFSQCSTTGKPIWVGYQDGSGPFVHVTGASDVYAFTITSPKGALVTVTPNAGSGFATTVQYYSRAELAAATGACAPAATLGKTITGSTTGIVSPNNPEISMGGASAFTLVTSPNFQLTNVPSGVLDLIAYNRTQTNLLSTGDQVLIHRDLNIADGGSTGAINFATEGVPVAVNTMTITGGAGSFFPRLNYLSGAACTLNGLSFNVTSASSPFLAYGVPASLQRPTDFHSLMVLQGNGQLDNRSVTTSFHTMADKSIAMGAGLGPVVVTSPTGGYRLEMATFTLAPDYSDVALYYSSTGTSNQFSVLQSAAWLGGNSAIVLAAPDLSPVAGYQASWAPPTSGTLAYSVRANSTVPPTMCAEGATYRFASSGQGAS